MTPQKKRIVICCDGTWNTPDTPTNVTKFSRAILPYSEQGIPQVVFYDQGVGTHNTLDKWLGGAFGKGVEQNVLDAYRFIAHNYQAGDELFMFGFSRGAYTARALTGMLHTIGILAKSELHQLQQAYRYYRTKPSRRRSEQYSLNPRPEIQFLGVWDTVGALGAPTPILQKLTRSWVGFFDTKLCPEVKNAYHALALDERREVFEPALWTGNTAPGQTVQQVWFAGCHSDVGGGYEESGLSDITLLWMKEKAAQVGLSFNDAYLQNAEHVAPDITARAHDSLSFGYKVLGLFKQGSGVRQLAYYQGKPALNVFMHNTVKERMTVVPDYHPENYDSKLDQTATDDKRKHLRRNMGVKGKIEQGKQTVDCTVLDYSPLGGVRIECDKPIKNNGVVTVSTPHFAKTVARLAWQQDKSYGLAFANMTTDTRH